MQSAPSYVTHELYTHSCWFQPTRVVQFEERFVEIIKADLTSSLEHVEVIKDTECKRCARLLRGRRKPPNAPKLDTRGDNAFPAIAVLDADSCDAGNIKKRE